MEFTRPKPIGEVDRPSKNDLVGALAVFQMRSYDPELQTTYGTQACATFDLTVIDGKHAGYVEHGRREFGNLGRQLGALDPGQAGVGRIIAGEGNQGRRWFGVEWARSDADFDAAKSVLANEKLPF